MKKNGIYTRLPGHFRSLCSFFLLLPLLPLHGQVSVELGGNVVGELGRSGADSHYYYNNIHRGYTSWRMGIKEANFLARLNLPKGFGIDSRLLLTRWAGQELRYLRLARLNAFWNKPNGKISLRLGRIQTPFGAFYDRPLPEDRLFVSPPLAYNYFVNISKQVGFSQRLREPEILSIDMRRDWGMPLAYEFGYSTGLNFHWEKRDTLSLDVAILQGSPGQYSLNQDFFQPNLMVRASFQPTYFWKQGFSLNYGGFMQQSPINEVLNSLQPYRQLMLGMHSSIGYTYFEFRTEVLASAFQAPEYLADTSIADFVRDGTGEVLTKRYNSLGGYADLKAELPFWPGSYLAYRFDYLLFDKLDMETWDDNSYRHSIALGIPINRFAMLQCTYALQQVVNQDWNLNQFRAVLILHL